jgi:hypothetical protein
VKRHLKASQANSTLATDGKYVVALFVSEGLFCFDVDGIVQSALFQPLPSLHLLSQE